VIRARLRRGPAPTSAGRSLLVLTLLAAGCTVTAPVDEPDPPAAPFDPPVAATDVDGPGGGTLRIGLSVDPVSIDPRFVVDEEGELIVDALFDPLVRLDQRLQVVPAAAERWEVDDDGTTLTFHLGDGRFHDGSPVTAADFKRSFDRIADGTADPGSYHAHLLDVVVGADRAQAEGGGLEGVEVVDDRTLVVRLDEPRPRFVETLTDPSLVPLPEAADQDVSAFGERPVGNGPFALAEPREREAFLRLSRVADHPRAPVLDEVLFQIYPDDPTRERQWQDLLDGQLQVAEVPAERLEDAVERFGLAEEGFTGPGLLDGITTTVYLYGFDTTAPPFDDDRVRRAISLAVDRQALADDVFGGARVPATALVPPSLPGAQPDACGHCRHDPGLARALLAEAAADGVTLERMTLAHNRGRTHAEVAERMAADIESALDVEVGLQAQDLQPFVRGVRSGQLPVFRLGWDANEPDGGGWLYPLFHSSQVGLDNLTRFADDEVDELLDEAARAPLRTDAVFANRAAERRILAEAPVMPLLWYRNNRVVGPEVEGLHYSPLGRIDLAAVSLDPDAR
jgi:oligopeptide transport system substrate-binding protein